MPTDNQTLLDLYIAAEAKILRGQSYRMGDRQLQLADLAEVRNERARLQVLVNRETAVASGRGGRFSQANFGGRT